jgi:hypothetical protein
VESLKRIADIANLSKDLTEITRRGKISAALISNNDISWDANFAMLVEYVGENFKLPEQRKSKLEQAYQSIFTPLLSLLSCPIQRRRDLRVINYMYSIPNKNPFLQI